MTFADSSVTMNVSADQSACLFSALSCHENEMTRLVFFFCTKKCNNAQSGLAIRVYKGRVKGATVLFYQFI